ncbi:N-acetyltransferase [Marinithermus hydrothermalis]|uniref:GCN5-related N-acetyltransferase n=1 Tax=Marinithermus hydrothermalis (strain DSM 14884 / JCM 11576 / T1) TaxID=869210 RepID=F2NM58_MARHT|nr:N-acetyltransferase [Marinithermus hydrothermalis]AEB11528.1 GCN5-related N-acetyltransferase [Marinithermus hydrothermalis DSM 14884]
MVQAGFEAAGLPEVRRDAAVELRKARVGDVEAIHRLIGFWAEKGLMLSRSRDHLYEHLRDFFVLEDEDGHVVGVAGLHVLWKDLAEVRGLAVHPGRQGHGLGRWLVLACEREARDLGVPRVFAWTLQVGFFTALGYRVTTREHLPPKVWSECNACPFYENCREIAVIKTLSLDTLRAAG